MADLFPKFRVTDPHIRGGNPQERRDAGKTISNGDGEQHNLSVSFLSTSAYFQAYRRQ